MIWLYICCLFFSAQLSYLGSATASVVYQPDPPDYYRAALFEHNRKGNLTTDTPSQIINGNLDYYERATEVAKSKSADIIVFPEYGITLFPSREDMNNFFEEIPDPRKVKANPCIQEQEFSNRPMLYRLSCMARWNSIVVVANIGEIQPCTKDANPNCPDDETFHFNTNVAFDRSGTIISKYSKEYLFYELGIDLPQGPQDPVFETDFGKFAMFICFESNYKHIVEIAQREDVDNIILTPLWLDHLPLWNSLLWFESFAMGNNVTYLVPNSNIPGYGSVGSGVFSGRMGTLKYTYNPDGLSKLLISRVPRSKHQTLPFPNFDSSITIITANGPEPYDEDQDGKDVPEYCSRDLLGEPEDINKDYRCSHESLENNTFVKLTKKEDNLTVCNNGLCCSLEYSAEDMYETYYLTAFNGTYKLADRYLYCRENCFVVRCDDFGERPCSQYPLKAKTIFHKFELRSNFTTKHVYPSILKSSARLTPISEWTHGLLSKGNAFEGYLSYESTSVQPLLVGALSGRCFDRDPPYKQYERVIASY